MIHHALVIKPVISLTFISATYDLFY